MLVPNTTVGGILQASPFELLLEQQLAGVKRSLFYTMTVPPPPPPRAALAFPALRPRPRRRRACLCRSPALPQCA